MSFNLFIVFSLRQKIINIDRGVVKMSDEIDLKSRRGLLSILLQ